MIDVFIKDNTKIIKAKVINDKSSLENETNINDLGKSEKVGHVSSLTKHKNLNNVAIYTFSQESYEPDAVLNVVGRIQNEVIILPKKESETRLVHNNGKSFDLVNYWRTQNVDAVMMYPKIINNDKVVDKAVEHKTINFYSHKIRNYFSESLKKTMDSFDSGIVMAMLFGDENGISKETNNIFRMSGISHILVLSGYNLILVIGFAAFLFKNFSLRKKIISSILFIFLFLLIAEVSAPVLRASIMSAYTLLTLWFLKPSNARFALWLTAFIFFIIFPHTAMYDVSFHLSFLATLGIIYLYPEFEELVKRIFFTTENKNHSSVDKSKTKEVDLKKYKKYESIVSVILVTVSANVLIFPYMIYQFGYFKLSAIFLSILVTPLVPIVMFTGFSSGILSTMYSLFSGINILFKFVSKIFFYLAEVFSHITEVFIDFIFYFAKYFYSLAPTFQKPMDIFTLSISYLFIFIFYQYVKFLNKQ